jgi:hypothetical protein
VSPGENSTYHLQFRAPQFRCTTLKYNLSVPLDGSRYNDGLVFESKWDSQSSRYSVTQHSLGDSDLGQGPQNITNYYVEMTEQTCKSVSVLYDVDISFPRGIRKIEHSQSNMEALLDKADVLDENGTMALAYPPKPQTEEDWHQKVLTVLPVINEWALLDSLGEQLVGSSYDNLTYRISGSCQRGINVTDLCIMATGNGYYMTRGTANKLQPLIPFMLRLICIQLVCLEAPSSIRLDSIPLALTEVYDMTRESI